MILLTYTRKIMLMSVVGYQLFTSRRRYKVSGRQPNALSGGATTARVRVAGHAWVETLSTREKFLLSTSASRAF